MKSEDGFSVPENSCLDDPLVIGPEFNEKEVVVTIGGDSKVEILDESVDSNIVIKAGEGSNIVYGKMSSGNVIAEVEDNASVNIFSYNKEKGSLRIVLKGKESVGNIISVCKGQGSDVIDLNAEMIHQGVNSSSDIKVKMILDDQAKGIVTGLVKVEKGVTGCNGYQQEDTLLLSKDARAEMIPNLEIDNNDVKCSHGATLSRVNDDQLFYLQSRGVGREDAKKMIVDGFLLHLIKQIPGKFVAEKALELFNNE